MYVVFRHSVDRCYKANVCSKATVFYILASLLTFVPPLLIAYRSQSMIYKSLFQPSHGLYDLCRLLAEDVDVP